jgi:hypothetical protein
MVKCDLCERSVSDSFSTHLKLCVTQYVLDRKNKKDSTFAGYYTCFFILNDTEIWLSGVPLNKFLAFKIYYWFIWKAKESNADCGLKNDFLLSVLSEIQNPNEKYLQLIPKTNVYEFVEEGIYREDLYLIFSRPQIFKLQNGNNF